MYAFKGLTFITNDVMTDTFQGSLRVRYINVIPSGDPMPSIVAATAMMVEFSPNVWILGHIMLDDSARGMGFASEMIRTLESEHGQFGAIWCTKSGEAFARKFVAKFGPRPSWKIGVFTDAEIAEKIQVLQQMGVM